MNKKQWVFLSLGIAIFIFVAIIIVMGLANSTLDQPKAVKIFILFNSNTLLLTVGAIYVFRDNKEN